MLCLCKRDGNIEIVGDTELELTADGITRASLVRLRDALLEAKSG